MVDVVPDKSVNVSAFIAVSFIVDDWMYVRYSFWWCIPEEDNLMQAIVFSHMYVSYTG